MLKTFEPSCGTIENVRIIRDKKTNYGKGFAYITFKERSSLTLALKMNNLVKVDNRVLRVSKCTDMSLKNQKNEGKINTRNRVRAAALRISRKTMKTGKKSKKPLGKKKWLTKVLCTPYKYHLQLINMYQYKQRIENSLLKNIKIKGVFFERRLIILMILFFCNSIGTDGRAVSTSSRATFPSSMGWKGTSEKKRNEIFFNDISFTVIWYLIITKLHSRDELKKKYPFTRHSLCSLLGSRP